MTRRRLPNRRSAETFELEVSGLARPQDRRLERLRRLLLDNVSLERAWTELNRGDGQAPQATVEALVYGLRDGIDALPTKPERLRRLSELSADQLKEVCARLQNFKPTIARPWTADEVDALVSIWIKSHG